MKSVLIDTSNTFIRTIISTLKDRTDYTAVISTAMYLVVCIFVPSNQLFFIVSAIYVAILFFFLRSFEKTLLYAYFPFSVLTIGQVYIHQAIPPETLKNLFYPEGKSLYFVFSPYTALVASAVVGIGIQIWKYRALNTFSYATILLVSISLLRILSSTQSETNSTFAVISAMIDFFEIAWVVLEISFLSQQRREDQTKTYSTISAIIMTLIIFQGSIAFLQLIERSTLGLLIEQTPLIPYFGAGSDENALLFRPIGLTPHANFLGNWMFCASISLLILASIIPRAFISGVYKKIYLYSFGVAVFTLFATQSRSEIVAFIVTMTIIMCANIDETKKIIKFTIRLLQPIKYIAIAACIYISFTVPNRIIYTIYSFSPSGGVTTREQLNKVAMTLTNEHPFLGVGNSMFVPAAFKMQSTGVMKYFPESVHNGFLLLLSENGYIVFALYCLYIYAIIRSAVIASFTRTTKSIIIAAIVGNTIIMSFQPYIGIVPMYFIIYLFVNVHRYENTSASH